MYVRSVAAATLIALRSTAVSAQPAATPPPASAAPASPPAPPQRAPIEVRFSLSPAAAEALSEVRLRRLLDIELPDTTRLSPGAAGPLDDQIAYVWIDRPSDARLEIQVRLDARPIVRRSIALAGLTSDVATRLVAIAASEIIRAEIRRMRAPRRPPPPRGPSPEEIEIASRDADALGLAAGPYTAVISAEPTLLAGPSIALSLRRLRIDQAIFARWLAGPLSVGQDSASAGPSDMGRVAGGALRWFEVGLALNYRLWASPTWRFSLGASASAASLQISSARSVDGIAGERDTWSARAGASLGAETRVGGPLWLGVVLEPGAVLRPAPFEDEAGAARAVQGAWIGLGLTLSVERVADAHATAAAAPRRTVEKAQAGAH